MFTPKLRIPEQQVVPDNYQGVLPDAVSVQNWLNRLDHTEYREFLDTLVSLNRLKCQPAIRMKIMNLIDSALQQELDDLLKKTELATFPVNEELQALSDTLQQLLLESSVAYQIILHDIAENEDYINHYLGDLIPESLFMALFYLSRLLVERFQLYLSEPVFIWEELNQLYLLAERVGAEEIKIKTHGSIKQKYLQIAILKLVDPYRLMRHEARKIYLLLEKWVSRCEIHGYTQKNSANCFVVDLLSDKSPHYFNPKIDRKEYNSQIIEGRVLKLDKLRTYIADYLAKVEQQKQTHVFSYQSRTHNEMLQRIENDMNLHKERSEERMFAGKEIKLVSGLRACHHFIRNRKPFKPQLEIDEEMKQNLEQNPSSDDDINLINLLEEEKLLNKKNPLGELQSVNPFLKESSAAGDEWDKIYTDSVINSNIDSSKKQYVSSMKEESWRQRNESAHGMLLVSSNDIEMPIAVGMLVANRLTVEKAYCLCVVRWLRVNPHKGMAIGVRLLAVQSKAIAVKGEKGTGAGGQFQRAFLISENVTKGKESKAHLILPAGVYGKGSILKVWHNNKLNSVKIKQILLMTDTFEEVSFQVLNDK